MKIKSALAEHRIRSRVEKCGFWMVDIPRTSSSALRNELAVVNPHFRKVDKPSYQYVRPHMTALEARGFLGLPLWDKVYKFTVVRNPWDRAVSYFAMLSRNGNLPDGMTFGDFAQALASRDSEIFPSFLSILSCADYISANGRLLVNKVVRFEDRAAGLAEVGEKVGIANFGQRRGRASDTRPYATYYDDRSREAIASVWGRDAEMFGYTFA